MYGNASGTAALLRTRAALAVSGAQTRLQGSNVITEMENTYNFPEVLVETRDSIWTGYMRQKLFTSRYKLLEVHIYIPVLALVQTPNTCT